MESYSRVKESHQGQAFGRAVPAWSLERAFCETVKVMPELCWRLQDVGDTRAVGYLPRRAAIRKWNQPKREKWVALNAVEES